MEKKLVVTARCDALKYQAETNYNKSVSEEQYTSCVSHIYKQIDKDGKAEMKSAFVFSKKVK